MDVPGLAAESEGANDGAWKESGQRAMPGMPSGRAWAIDGEECGEPERPGSSVPSRTALCSLTGLTSLLGSASSSRQ